MSKETAILKARVDQHLNRLPDIAEMDARLMLVYPDKEFVDETVFESGPSQGPTLAWVITWPVQYEDGMEWEVRCIDAENGEIVHRYDGGSRFAMPWIDADVIASVRAGKTGPEDREYLDKW